MLNIFHNKNLKRWIFSDFAFMDERESEYTRKVYEANLIYSQYSSFSNGYGNGFGNTSFNPMVNPMMNPMSNPMPNRTFDLSSFSLANHPLNLVNPIQPTPPVSSAPPALIKPPAAMDNQIANLGFQLNPVGKNKKK